MTHMKPILGLIWLCFLLSACNPQPAIPTPPPTPSATPVVSSTPEKPAPQTPVSALVCATSFERRELKEPYQRRNGQQPRYTLSTAELNNYLAVMGIESLCVPPRLGAPFINVDWDSRYMPAQGRLLSIGFEALYAGSGWSEVYLVYATYDFKVGSEYTTFARPTDRDAVRQGTLSDMVEVDGVKGFIRYQVGYYAETTSPAYKAIVFPFDTYYIAAVYSLWGYYPNDDAETVMQKLRAGEYPPERLSDAQALDFLVQSIRFQPLPQP